MKKYIMVGSLIAIILGAIWFNFDKEKKEIQKELDKVINIEIDKRLKSEFETTLERFRDVSTNVKYKKMDLIFDTRFRFLSLTEKYILLDVAREYYVQLLKGEYGKSLTKYDITVEGNIPIQGSGSSTLVKLTKDKVVDTINTKYSRVESEIDLVDVQTIKLIDKNSEINEKTEINDVDTTIEGKNGNDWLELTEN